MAGTRHYVSSVATAQPSPSSAGQRLGPRQREPRETRNTAVLRAIQGQGPRAPSFWEVPEKSFEEPRRSFHLNAIPRSLRVLPPCDSSTLVSATCDPLSREDAQATHTAPTPANAQLWRQRRPSSPRSPPTWRDARAGGGGGMGPLLQPKKRSYPATGGSGMQGLGMRSSRASRRGSNRGVPGASTWIKGPPAPQKTRLHPVPLPAAASSPPPQYLSLDTPESRLQTGCKEELHARKAPQSRGPGEGRAALAPAALLHAHAPPNPSRPDRAERTLPYSPATNSLTRDTVTAAGGGEQEGADKPGKSHASRPESQSQVSSAAAGG